jgi:methylmalonyl-CoA mutase N-terminal domain/subunit
MTSSTERNTDSGVPIAPVYRAADAGTPQPDPGTFPFTRGIYPTMYRGRLWTMRQYAGFASARESNQRYRYLLQAGQTGLSVAFDLPTQLGLDSDDPRAEGEVGKVGVAIDSLRDMELLLDGIPLDSVTTSMTINAPASVLLLLYQLVAEAQGVSSDQIGGTIQNDILKEYAARGTYIFPPRPSMRLITDTFAIFARRAPPLCRRSPSPWPMASPTWTPPFRPGSMWMPSPRASPFSLSLTPTFWKRWRSSARPVGSGPP